MVIASYIFYGWWDWHYVFLLGGSTIANQVFARAIAPLREPARRVLLIGAVTVNLGALAYFKYYGFFATSIVNSLSDIGIKASPPLFQIILPIGISFFTFQAISLRRRHLPRARSNRSRSSTSRSTSRSSRTSSPARSSARREFLPQLQERPTLATSTAAEAFRLIVAGMFKKVVISSYLARRDRRSGLRRAEEPQLARGPLRASTPTRSRSTRTSAATPTSRSASRCCSASASPRTSTRRTPRASLQDFWRRWHMTLSRWLARLPLHPARRQPRQPRSRPTATSCSRC